MFKIKQIKPLRQQLESQMHDHLNMLREEMHSNIARSASPSHPPPPGGSGGGDADAKIDELMKTYQDGCNSWLEDTLYTKLNEWSCMYTYQMEQDAQKASEALNDVEKEKSSLVTQRSELESKLTQMTKSYAFRFCTFLLAPLVVFRSWVFCRAVTGVGALWIFEYPFEHFQGRHEFKLKSKV